MASAEKVLGLVEPRFFAGAVFFAAFFEQSVEFFQQFALCFGQLDGRFHLNMAIQVACAG